MGKLFRTTPILAFATLVLVGCDAQGQPPYIGNSTAYNLGYEQAYELQFEKISNLATAKAFCTTIAQNIYQPNTEQELNDYIAGCASYVLSK